MLNFLTSVFLSITITATSGSVNFTTQVEPRSASEYDISAINRDTIDMGYYTVGFIGRHKMMQITDVDTAGSIEPVQKLTNYYDASTLTNFKFKENVTISNTYSVSTVEELSQEISLNLNIALNINIASLETGVGLKNIYTIRESTTYTYSTETTYTIEYEPVPEVIAGKIFALCLAAEVHEITFETWEYDDYWWGDYEVSGSRKTHIAYLVIDPYVTIMIHGEGIVN